MNWNKNRTLFLVRMKAEHEMKIKEHTLALKKIELEMEE